MLKIKPKLLIIYENHFDRILKTNQEINKLRKSNAFRQICVKVCKKLFLLLKNPKTLEKVFS